MKKIFKKLYFVATLTAFNLLFFTNFVFAEDPSVDTFASSFKGVLNIFTGIFVFISIVLLGWEFLFHRKDEQKRSETVNSIPYIAAGVFILAFAAQIVKMFIK